MNKRQYEYYIPQEVYYDFLNEINMLSEKFKHEEIPLTIEDKVCNFFFNVNSCLNLYNEDVKEIYSNLYKSYIGINSDLDLIAPEHIIKMVIREELLPFISNYLDHNDNTFFWRAFGVSIEKGNLIKRQLLDIDNYSNIINELQNEIFNGCIIDKNTICRQIFPKVLQLRMENTNEDNLFPYHYASSHFCEKYPRIIESIKNDVRSGQISTDVIFDYSEIVKYTTFTDLKNSEYNPKVVFNLLCLLILVTPEEVLILIHYFFSTNNFYGDAIKVLFRIHKNGYEIYKYYLDYCCKKHVEPRLTIEDLEVFFINSYKVPQLKSLCNRYFPSASEEESKKETKKCFKKIFYDLRDKKFLNCSINEFLWAFGLTDKYPEGFKRIAFQTPQEKKANGAFLALLKILVYEEDEIKEMRQERKNKPNLINQIFDLTLSRKTKESKDCRDLLKIVKNSGLPVKE